MNKHTEKAMRRILGDEGFERWLKENSNPALKVLMTQTFRDEDEAIHAAEIVFEIEQQKEKKEAK